MTSAGHHSHAAIRLVKICQTVTDLDAHQRQSLMSQIPRDADVSVPPSPERCSIRILWSFIDERSRVEMNVWTQQLYYKGYGCRMVNKIEQCVLFENAGTQVYVIIFGPAQKSRFLKKRIRQAITCLHETRDRSFAKRTGQH